jgi:hypothetical protein
MNVGPKLTSFAPPEGSAGRLGRPGAGLRGLGRLSLEQ